jgi:hypothetical protein
MTPKIMVNNVPVLASSPVQWALRSGIKPVIMEYDMSVQQFNNFKSGLGTVNGITLKISLENNKTLEIRNLYYVGNSVGTNPHIKRIMVADRRWLWNRHVIYRKYNIRRHVGVKRLTTIDVRELQETAPEVRYAKYSVKATQMGNVEKWTAKEIIEDIIKEMVAYEKKYNSKAGNYVFRGEFKKDIPVENFMLDDSGDTALNKALALIAGSDVFVGYDGNIIIYDKSSNDERTAEDSLLKGISRGGAMMVNFGNLEMIDKSFLRPKEVRVMFRREIEVRFDHTEAEGETVAEDENRRDMDNVISLPDWELEIEIKGKKIKQAQGTWMKIGTVLNEWNLEAQGLGGVVAEFSLAYLRKAFVPFIDFWSPFLLNGVLTPDRDWAARVASIMMHWRRTFRLNPNWIDRISNLKAYRIATIDQATGQRAPAIAYANYSQLYTERSFYFDLANNQSPSYYSNFPGGLASDTGLIASINNPAPAKVAVLDADQGILHLDFLGDVYRLRENTIPGIIGNQRITSAIQRAKIENIAFDAIGSSQSEIPEIIDGTIDCKHITTVILTVISASPNDNRQYHVVVKKPDELEDLPKTMEAKGPPIEVIVGSAIETARIRWLDEKKENIEKLFGVGLTPEAKPDEEITLSREVDELVINRGEAKASGKELYGSLEEIAKAVAYRVYLSLLDRVGGSASVDMRPGMLPRGYIDEISQEINPDGVALTRISSPVEIPELDLFGLMDENSRAVILKLAEVGK